MPKTPCIPDLLPLTVLDWQKLLPICGRANAAIARYDGMLQTLPNPAVLLSPITVNEAVLSSKIEGTVATLDEVLGFDAGLAGDISRQGDIEEIMNYRQAVRIAEQSLEERPLTLSLIKTVHQRLLQGVRGRDKEPGSVRRDQNWIGKPGDTMESARFIPPNPLILGEYLANWEAFLSDSTHDPVLATAIGHAQFEILHPFKDGNGRIGRMLIPLILYKNRALSRPMFYVSEYLETHRETYYDRLLAITDRGDWHGWLEFFINAVTVQAEANLAKVKAIRDLYEEMRQRFVEVTHSQFAMAAVDAFFVNPIISGPNFADRAGFNTRMTANGVLRQLETAGLILRLREGAGRSPSVYAMPRLIDITEGKATF